MKTIDPPTRCPWLLTAELIVAMSLLPAGCSSAPGIHSDCPTAAGGAACLQPDSGTGPDAGDPGDSGTGCAACVGTPLGIRSFGDAGDDIPMDSATDRQGNLIIVGYFDGTLDLGAGPMTSGELSDVFVVKLRPDGTAMWSKRFGDDNQQEAQRVAVDADGNVVIIGTFRGTVDFGGGPLVSAGSRDAFVVKLDADGNHVWSKRFGDRDEQFGRGVATDGQGNVFIAGTAWGTVDFGGGPLKSAGFDDIFVAKLDKDGQHLWSKLFGDAQTQEAWDLATDADGNVAMAAYILGNVDFGDGLTQGGANPDAAVVKLSGDGATLWSHRYGDQQQQFGQGIAVDSQGNVVFTGLMQGSVEFGDGPVQSAGAFDFFIAKFDPMGKVLWHHRYGDQYDQPSLLVSVDATDAVLLTGFFLGTVDFGGTPLVSAGGTDAFAAKLDSAGHTLWSRRMGDAADQKGSGITSDLTGGVNVIGLLGGTIEVGDASVTNASPYSADAFIARFGP